MSAEKKYLVITTINPPSKTVVEARRLAPDWTLVVAADRKTPRDWSHPGVTLLDGEAQESMGLALAERLPWNHYARKNLGYLHAIRNRATVIAETDDDNIPSGEDYLKEATPTVTARPVKAGRRWINIYRCFTDEAVWPRGFPLEEILRDRAEPLELEDPRTLYAPIQQYLADGDPDVDAVYRLTSGKDITFRPGSVALADGSWCPFNSQNTIWFPDAYPLLYLPSHVSFRMTDIWRSFIALRCLREIEAQLFFGSATMYQERNVHDYLRDFADEIPGYLANARFVDTLESLKLLPGTENVLPNLLACYDKLVTAGFIPEKERPLVEAWAQDLRSLAFDS